MEDGTTLNTSLLVKVSGYEYGFSLLPWAESEESANCYSYALGHFSLRSRAKPQPGDVARFYEDLRRPYDLNSAPLWRDCKDIVKRIAADGIATWRMLEFPGNGSTIVPADMDAPSPPGYYKIYAVTDGVTGGSHTTTDYHLMRHDAYNIKDLYVTPLYNYVGSTPFRVTPNPYEALGLDPYVSGNHIEDLASGSLGSDETFHLVSGLRDVAGVPARLVRSATNIRIHLARIPEYAIREGNLIPDPFWIMGANPHNPRSDEVVMRRKQELDHLFGGDELALATIAQAAADCATIRERPGAMPPKNMLVGLWSHKLGFASGPINTDGDSKLILDPRRAKKQHGDLNYNNNCGCFNVLRGQGIAQVPLGLGRAGI